LVSIRIWQRYVVGYLALAFVAALLVLPAPSTPVLADDTVRIDVPADGADVSGRVEIRGRATTADPSHFSFYRLYYGQGDSPSVLRPIGNPSDKPIVVDVLGVWDTAPLLTGPYLVQLTVYDDTGGMTTAHVVVNVLPAPTPTPQTNQPPAVVVPQGTPPPDDQQDNGPTPTPIPELPQLDPNIPQIDVPPPDQSAPQVQPVVPQQTDPGLQPINIPNPNPLAPSSLPPPALPPAPAALPTVDLGPGPAPAQPIDINPVAPPLAPNVAPYVPPPPPPTIVPPTVEGLPL
jgi:hypothetical protein